MTGIPCLALLNSPDFSWQTINDTVFYSPDLDAGFTPCPLQRNAERFLCSENLLAPALLVAHRILATKQTKLSNIISSIKKGTSG